MLPNNVWRFLYYFSKKYKFFLFTFILFNILVMFFGNIMIPNQIRIIVNNINDFNVNIGVFQSVKNNLFNIFIFSIFIIFFEICMRTSYILSFSKIRNYIYYSTFNYVERHSFIYFQNNFGGSIGNKVSKLADTSEKFLYYFSDLIIVQFLLKSFQLLYIYKVHYSLFLVNFIWAISYITINLYMNKRTRPAIKKFEEEKSSLVGKIVDGFNNIINIKSFAHENYERHIIKSQTQLMYKKEIDVFKIKVFLRGFCNLISNPLIFINLFIAIKLLENNLINIGDFVFTISISQNILFSTKFIANAISDLSEQIAAMQQGLDIISMPLDIKNKEHAKKLEINFGKIEFKNIKFFYKN